jgi:hypothetical protein
MEAFHLFRFFGFLTMYLQLLGGREREVFWDNTYALMCYIYFYIIIKLEGIYVILLFDASINEM